MKILGITLVLLSTLLLAGCDEQRCVEYKDVTSTQCTTEKSFNKKIQTCTPVTKNQCIKWETIQENNSSGSKQPDA